MNIDNLGQRMQYDVSPPSAHTAMFDRSSGAAGRPLRLVLGIGAAHVALHRTIIWTVLGSCLSVIMHAPAVGVSAMCHAQLPKPIDHEVACRASCPHPCHRRGTPAGELKYVTCSIDYMITSLARHRITKSMIVCALVGGADVLPTSGDRRTIGGSNIDAARRILKEHRLPVRFEDVGGQHGRTLTYDTSTGELTLRRAR